MIPKLRPGQELTEAHVNQIIDGVNAAHITSPNLVVERTTAGTKLGMPRRQEDLYARIIETEGRERGDDGGVKDGEYEWKEVYLPGVVDNQYPPEEFEDYPEGSAHGSQYDSETQLVYNPAYELSNDRTIPVDTLIRLRVYTAIHDHVNERGFIRRYVFNHGVGGPPLLWAEAIDDWNEGGTYPEGNPYIRCYRLVTDPEIEPTASEPYPKMRVGPEGETGDDVDQILVELPRERGKAESEGNAHSTDPALYEGDRLQYMVDDQERLICQSPFLHMGKIGDIRSMGMTKGHPANNVPVGWWECDGTERKGNAGTFNLANFFRDQLALGGPSGDLWGSIPSHWSSSHEVADPYNLFVFDGIGEFGGQIQLPAGAGQAQTTAAGVGPHTHSTRIERGEYPVEIVFYYQRFK